MEICAHGNPIYVDVDPGSGSLLTYSDSTATPGCFIRDLGYAVRKFRVWTWSAHHP